ncbi:MAG: O-antigen ligase family protein [Christensenellales bacterium]
MDKASLLNFSDKTKKFLYSDLYLAIIVLIGALAFVLRLEKFAIIALLIVASYNLIVVKDVLPNFIIITVIAMTPLTRYNEEGYFLPLKYAVPLVVIALIIHLVIYPPKLISKRFLLPTILVAIAVTLGGLFSPYYMNNFKMPALYYIIALGIGMIGVYMFFESYVEKDEYIKIYFCKMMIALGLLGTVMVAVNYFRYAPVYSEKGFSALVNKFQFGNNLSSNLLLTMPFAFYMSTKGKHAVLYFVLGCLQYLAMLFSLSRGGIIFSTLLAPICITLTLYYTKKDRLKILVTSLVIIVATVLPLRIFAWDFIIDITEQIDISSGEARMNLYKLAWQNFLSYPVFGTGLGYSYPAYYYPKAWCIYWYHSTLFQILGSLGVLGIICYGYQYLVRLKTVFEYRDKFNIYVLLSFVGFEAYQLVNVGNFAPLPYVLMLIVMYIVLNRNNDLFSAVLDGRRKSISL